MLWPALTLALLASTVDADPPIISDVAAAASNPAAPPVITVMLSDPGSGVATATVYFRGDGTSAFQQSELKGGTTGLFIARLPDGLQRSGFAYYVEAVDIAGNRAHIGSPERPIVVDKAEISTLDRIKDLPKEPDPSKHIGSIHPGWVALALGVGVLGAAGAGAFVLDLTTANHNIGAIDDRLADPDLSDNTRRRLEASRGSFADAVVNDTAAAAVLGVVAGAGLITGTVLLVLSSIE